MIIINILKEIGKMKQDLEHLAHNLQPWRPWRILKLDNDWAPILPCTQETSAAFVKGCALVLETKFVH